MARYSGDFLELQRKQLDAQLSSGGTLRSIRRPRTGWIRTIRTALGMSAVQLGRRLGMTRQGVTALEKAETAETITLATLRKVAHALECDLVVALVPNETLEKTVRQQAQRKATEERNRVVHTMRLEAQETGIHQALDVNKSVDSWLTARLKRLWD